MIHRKVNAYGLKSALVFLAAIVAAAGGADLSSPEVAKERKPICPVETGQKYAQKYFDSVFTESNFPAEDMGLEPTTP